MSKTHDIIKRPWGSYQVLLWAKHYKIKKVRVAPGRRLSFQYHLKRSEHWIVVKGQALVTNSSGQYLLMTGQSLYVPKKEAHRLQNPGRRILEIIEIQQGNYLGEDDIVRLNDDFKRCDNQIIKMRVNYDRKTYRKQKS